MEHDLRRDEGRLLEVYDKPEPKVTMETEVMKAGRLADGRLSIEAATGAKSLVKSLGAVAKPNWRTFHL